MRGVYVSDDGMCGFLWAFFFWSAVPFVFDRGGDAGVWLLNSVGWFFALDEMFRVVETVGVVLL